MIPVLYVDDEKPLLEIGKCFLEVGGVFSVDTTTSAKNALELLQSNKYEVIISDFEMPGMNGIELLKTVRKSHNNIPFILFTGRGREEIVIQALNEGADYYLQKGGDTVSLFAELTHKVLLAVNRRKAEIALQESEERYRAVVEDQTELICRFLQDGKLTFANGAFCRYFKKDNEECINLSGYEFIYPDDIPVLLNQINSLTPETPVIQLEFRIILPDGRIRWHHANIRAIINSEGQIGEYQGVGNDVTIQKEADEKLRESENRFAAFLNNFPAAAFMKDAQGNYLVMNSITKDILYKPENIGKSGYDIFSPDIVDDIISSDKKALQNGYSKGLQVIPDRDNQIHIYELHKFRIDEQNKDPLIGGFAIDITDRKKAEDALKESEEQSRVMIEHIQDGAFLSQDGILLLCNEALAAMTGHTREEIIGRPVSDIIAPEDYEMVIKRQKTRLEGKNSLESYEFSLIHKDGSTRIPVKISVGTGTYQDHLAAIGTVHNLAKELESESALKKSEEKYRDIYNNVNIGLFTSTPDGRFLHANPYAVKNLGYDSEEDFIRSITDIGLQRYADLNERDEVFQILRTKGFIENYQTRFFRKDGKIIWGSINAKVVRNEDGTVIIEGSCQDITERKESELALIESEKRLQWIYNSGLIGIIYWSADGGANDANDEFLELLGFSRDELNAGLINWHALTPEEYRPLDAEALAVLKETGIYREPYEKEYFRKDGKRVRVLMAGAILDKKDRKNGVGFVIDLTNTKKINSN